jgi:hypothetical protein
MRQKLAPGLGLVLACKRGITRSLDGCDTHRRFSQRLARATENVPRLAMGQRYGTDVTSARHFFAAPVFAGNLLSSGPTEG